MKNKDVIDANEAECEELRSGDVCFFFPRFMMDVETGRAKLFVRGSSTVKVVKNAGGRVWVSTGGGSVPVRRIQLSKVQSKAV